MKKEFDVAAFKRKMEGMLFKKKVLVITPEVMRLVKPVKARVKKMGTKKFLYTDQERKL